ncbi:MAG: formylmethanofuran dehydrogenase subunit A [Rhodospirillaceae bacterium]|nr:formylmethanofuran dehydrogenase subunit A [Rhodospirillaceae bacterium]MBT5375096.1 formylmethanofuran dehydrogenase subunit A [Rhodospirillaceae bacterium]MBT5659256.1 formylmethanofuran dehydrogenase subunit A [Rhodospirillaceae bacterium]MBT5751701.1 formylmethanofuran dehydrogenase subunit A [Rhodospirillaceae bacterium]
MLRIVNGKVYDPANGVDGEVREVCVKDGKIVESVPASARKIDAKGMVIMPGGVDIHCHIAGSKVNMARKLQPDDHRHDVHPRTEFTRSGTGGTVPSTFTTGYRYTTLGYTTAMEAAVAPIGARHALEELHDTPIIDKGYFILMGNNVLLHKLMQEGEHDKMREALAWWVNATKAYSIKLVNPGADEPWKGHRNRNITTIDQEVDAFEGITPRKIIQSLVRAADELGLPHSAHIHCNNLGHSGNYTTTLETMKAAEGHRAHITHIQFHSYGGEIGDNPLSEAAKISEYVNTHPNITADVGQVMFGRSTIMTADAPLAYLIHPFSKDTRWINADSECESGCGITPFSYQEKIYTHAMQWAVGLELFLLSKDPWRMVLSTDHPNGGSFMSYPRLIKLLMDREFRKAEIKKVNQKAVNKTILLDNPSREYSLYEIAIITRAGPARILGLKNKGHIGVGADADITIYEEDADKEMMFSAPRYVIKDGTAIIDNHEFTADSEDNEGRLFHVEPAYDSSIEEVIRPFFDDFYSIRFDNYPVADSYLHDHEIVATSPGKV